MPSKKKASILNRDNYQTGGPAEEQSPSDAALDEQVAMYQKLSNAAKTPEEQKQVNDSFGDMLAVILKRIQGGGGEELFGRGELGDDLTVKSPDDPKELRMGQATGGSLIGKQTELDVNNDGKISGKDFQMLKKKRMGKQEGSLMMPPEMESDMPVDTYPNIPPEEMDEAMASQLPDADMEDKYLDFVLEESLDDEEQSYLMNALEADPKLSQIFDKVVTTASEFTGAGEVEGPGTGVSDSIPARLSDGEFVFTKKATDQMGADNLQMMMDDAERAFDGGQMRESAETGGLLLYNQEDDNPLAYEKIAQDEIKKNMLRSNRAPSLMAG